MTACASKNSAKQHILRLYSITLYHHSQKCIIFIFRLSSLFIVFIFRVIFISSVGVLIFGVVSSYVVQHLATIQIWGNTVDRYTDTQIQKYFDIMTIAVFCTALVKNCLMIFFFMLLDKLLSAQTKTLLILG